MVSKAASQSVVARIFYGIGSLKVAFWLLVALMVLTFAGTLEQQNMSLFDVQEQFFESIVLVWWVGGKFPVPLLGGYLLLSLVFLNLLVGGVIRLRKRQATVGILIAHLGILALLFGTFLEHQFSTKGQMTLWAPEEYQDANGNGRWDAEESYADSNRNGRWDDGETGDSYRSSNEWELVVALPTKDGKEVHYILPQGDLEALEGGGSARVRASSLPFDVVLSGWARNAEPRRAMAHDARSADGFVLTALKPVGTDENRTNLPGVLVSLEPKEVGPKQQAVLWGGQREPWVVSAGGTIAYVDLRRRTWDLPFKIHLQKFIHERHPGMAMAKRFSSFVTKVEGTSKDPNIHITMNEPLRYEGYTFYQSGWGPQNARPGDRLYSTFSVVANPTDQWPKWMTYVIALGLVIHFLRKLILFLTREAKKTAKTAVTALVLLGAFAGVAQADDTAPKAPPGGAWSDEVRETVSIIPVQSEGRVKPLSTWSSFALLGINGRRSCKDASGETIDHLDWMLDCMFRPEWAKHHQAFLVSTNEVLDAVGLTDAVKKKRDRYSYAELATPQAREELNRQARQYIGVDEKERTRVQSAIVDLERSFQVFEGLIMLGEYARRSYRADAPALQEIFPGVERVNFLDVVDKMPALQARMQAGDAGAAAINTFLLNVFGVTEYAIRMGLFPPAESVTDAPAWLTLQDVVEQLQTRGSLPPQHIEALRLLGAMSVTADDPARFAEFAELYQRQIKTLAEARGEYSKIEQEVHLYSLDPFGKSLVYYLIAFALLAVTWLVPKWRWLEIVGWVILWGTLALHTYGIVLRCLIRERPPISTLYETVLFVTAAGVLFLLLTEHMVRRKVALSLAPIVGVIGLFIASRYEALKGTDTMPQLVAVLDTNFWLATHVTCISIGYCAGLLAGLLAHIYIFAKLFGGSRVSSDFLRSVGRMVYGTLCFALLFSLIGTILGGIWANDSWGRFWGWDPKENGALLICLSQLAILHGRMSGYFKTFGVCMAAIFGGMIIAFSWWGVNLLGIGLHSYGFTSGIMKGLMIFYGIELAVLGAGFIAWLRDRGVFTSSAAPTP